MDAEFSGLITACGYDTALLRPSSDNERLPRKSWVVAGFHGGEKSVHVNMDYLPVHQGQGTSP